MENLKTTDLFSQRYTSILIAVKFLGIYWEFWSEHIVIGDDSGVFFREVRDKYKKKFKNRDFHMRLYYPNEIYVVTNNTVKHLT